MSSTADAGELQAKYARTIGAGSAREILFTSLQLPRVLEPAGTRPQRERVWRAMMSRRLEARAALQAIWQQLVHIRSSARRTSELAALSARSSHAGNPLLHQMEKVAAFHLAIEEFATSVVTRHQDEQRLALNVRTLRPWDLLTSSSSPPSSQFASPEALAETARILLARLDIGKRLPVDVCIGTVVTESGENTPLPTGAVWPLVRMIGRTAAAQHEGTMQEAVAISLELLAASELTVSVPGFENEAAVRSARLAHLHELLLRWPALVMADAYEHWTVSAEAAGDAEADDAEWKRLWLRFLPGIDWSGLDTEMPADRLWWPQPVLEPGRSLDRALGQLLAVQLVLQRGGTQALHFLRKALESAGSSTSGDPMDLLDFDPTWDTHAVREAVAAIDDQIDRLHP